MAAPWRGSQNRFVIQVDGLCKVYRVPEKSLGLAGSVRSLWRRRYRQVPAVQELSFRIEAGERVGFLGPNGAGKTTTLKMLSGLLKPTGGRLSVAGFEPFRRHPDFLRRITLVMGQKQQLLWDLPAAETFELNRALFDLEATSYRATLAELIELLQLEPLLQRPVRNLSLGERMKCELAAALLHKPDILFLDEPTIGLDVTMQEAVRSFVAEWNERQGATVLLTSHYMADIAALCSRVLVIAGGRLRFDGALDELVERYAPDRRIRVRTTQPVNRATAAAAGPFLPVQGGCEALVPGHQVKEIVHKALLHLPVRDLVVEEAPLEDVIRRLFEQEKESHGKPGS
ncbi:MAG: ATP-binding cassette domain-containing protein [Planctomycetota bacterium]|nr:MAG: ATP-binding cassette domain-containing protein [Planctomycetota bacterium]